MTVCIEGDRGFYLGAAAQLVDNDRELASSWAAPHIVPNSAHKWVLGRFVEAERANNNRQLFGLDGLQMGRPSITHAPMNMNHASRRIVGAFVATDLIYPTGVGDPGEDDEEAKTFSTDQRDKLAKKGQALPDGSFPIENESDLRNAIQAVGRAKDPAAARRHIIKRARALGLSDLLPEGWTGEKSAATAHPYIEALGVFWRYYFPEEYALVEDAHARGALFYSMECVPNQIQCAGDGGCGEVFDYFGRQDASYCDHLNDNAADKLLIEPHFTGGALIIPPVQPGWANADVHSLVAQHSLFAERVHQGISEERPHLSPVDWEALMNQVMAITKM